MCFQVGRLVRYHKCKFLPKKSLGILRLSTCDDPCPPKCPPPPIHVDGTCPQPPPCSDSPPTANRLCPYNPDPGNPCNYSPPACPDPEQPELTRLKKLQCRFQVRIQLLFGSNEFLITNFLVPFYGRILPHTPLHSFSFILSHALNIRKTNSRFGGLTKETKTKKQILNAIH